MVSLSNARRPTVLPRPSGSDHQTVPEAVVDIAFIVTNRETRLSNFVLRIAEHLQMLERLPSRPAQQPSKASAVFSLTPTDDA
jgi:hypothetical protein